MFWNPLGTCTWYPSDALSFSYLWLAAKAKLDWPSVCRKKNDLKCKTEQSEGETQTNFMKVDSLIKHSNTKLHRNKSSIKQCLVFMRYMNTTWTAVLVV